MKKLTPLFLLFLTILTSCSSDSDIVPKETTINIDFTHNWDDVSVTKADFNDVKFTNENGEEVSIERLRYLVSNIYLTNISGSSYKLEDYLLVDIGEEENLTYTTDNLLPNGTYNFSFVFGFSNEDNQDGIYPDLNTASFGVPIMLGGGYHYMQFDGKFTSQGSAPAGFNYHAIRAVNNTNSTNLILKDTSFTVNLGQVIVENNSATIEVKMNIAEWFKNPNTWDLNALNQMLMPNYEAQLLMSENGKTAFSL